MNQVTQIDANLHRLFVLRNITLAGEVFTVIGVTLGLGIILPIAGLTVIFIIMTVLNILTWRYLRKGEQAGQDELFLQLMLDVVAFSCVLYLTGGATNPFAWFYLIPLMIAATLLSRRLTWLVALMTVLAYSILMFKYVPLPGDSADMHAAMGHSMHSSSGFSQHIMGMWFGFVMSAALVAHFIVDMATTLRERDRHLADAREKALRDERLIALGTLAAGAAHELGTPLGTISLLVTDLQEDYSVNEHPELSQKLQMMQQQVKRCKQALSAISVSAGEARADSGCAVSPSEYLHGIVEEWKEQHPAANLQVSIPEEPSTKNIIAERTITQAFINILNNAADASADDIMLQGQWDDKHMIVEVLDRGAGLSDKDIKLIGDTPFSSKSKGLGVGLFISYAAIDRFGGSLSHTAREGGGTCVRIELPYLN